MKTVSSIVENYIKTKPFLLNALSLGIIINEVISTSNEFTILVGEDQVDVAFKVIKDLKN